MIVYRLHNRAVIRDTLLHIPYDWVDGERLQAALTISNGAYWTALQAGQDVTGIPPRIALWSEQRTGCISIPRNFNFRPFLTPAGVIEHERLGVFHVGAVPLSFDVSHRVQLRDQVQAEASQALTKTRKDKMLALACGKGKTVVTLHALSEGKRWPALIVVHTNELLSQWRERIAQFLEVDEDDIGHVQQNVCEWRDKPIVVAMLHTLCKRRMPSEFYAYFRTIVFDEVHRLATEYFSIACQLLPGERWGLSATMKRDDGMDQILRLHCGEVAYQNLEQPLKPKVFFVQTGVHVNDHRFTSRNGHINIGRLMTFLGEQEERNRLILAWLRRAAQSGRTILVLGERIAQLHWFYEQLDCPSKAMCVGSMPAEARREALKKQVVLATQQLAKEGLDRPSFDTLFIFTPFSGEGRLRQSIGRVLREVDAKQQPVVMIFQDDSRFYGFICNKMRRHLAALKYTCSTVSGTRDLAHDSVSSARPGQPGLPHQVQQSQSG